MISAGSTDCEIPNALGGNIFAFVDADNFRLGLLRKLRALEINETAANQYDMLNLFRQFYRVSRFYLYNSVPLGEEPEQWIKDLRATQGFIFRGTLLRDSGGQRKQEGVDVRLAVEAMQAAHRRTASSCAIFSDDGDLIPLVNALIDEGMTTTIVSFGNPDKSEVAARLRDAADHFIQIGHSIIWNAHVTSQTARLPESEVSSDMPQKHQLVEDNDFGPSVRVRRVGNDEIELYDLERPPLCRVFSSRDSAILWYRLTGSVHGSDSDRFPIEGRSSFQTGIMPSVTRR